MQPILRTLLLLAGLTALLAAPALAAEGGSGNPWLELLYKAINFVVLVGILWYFLRKPVGNFFRNTARDEKAALDTTRQTEADAVKELEAQKTRIAQMQQELERMLADARTDAAAEMTLMTGEANAHAERMKQAALQKIDQEFRKARLELRRELATQTLDLAEAGIKSRIGPADHQRLVREYIDQLGS
jgi:F-type H+-transporting ATPase subunit b